MTVCDGDGGVVHTTLWHGTLDGGMAVDDDGGEDDNEYDSHLDMGTRTILIVLCPSFLGPCAWGHPPALGRALGKNLGQAVHRTPQIFLLCQCHIVLCTFLLHHIVLV